MKHLLTVAALVFSVLLSGCATLADAQAAKGSGTARIYQKDYADVWSTVLATVSESGLSLVSQDKDKGTVLAQRGISAFSWGENVAIFVERVDGGVRTRVEVVNKRAVTPNITAAYWESDIVGRLDKKLK